MIFHVVSAQEPCKCLTSAFLWTMLDCCIWNGTVDWYNSSQSKWCSSVPALPCGKLSTSQEFPGMLPIRAPWHYFVRSVSNNLWIASPFHYMTVVEALQFRQAHDGKRMFDRFHITIHFQSICTHFSTHILVRTLFPSFHFGPRTP